MKAGSQKGVGPGAGKERVDTVSECYIYLVQVSDVGLKRGRCHQCQKSKRMPSRVPLQSVVFDCARGPALLNFTSTDSIK